MKNYLEKNKKRPYDLRSLLFRHIIVYFMGKIVRSDPLELPKTIGEYEFESEMKKIGPRKSYLLAIYKNNKGERVLLKMRNSGIKDYHYFSLKNEIILYAILNNALKRLGNKIPQQFKQFYIPKVLSVVDDDTSLAILMEFMEGTTAQKLNPDRKISLYLKTVDFLQFIGESLTPDEKRMISTRSPYNYISLYPLLLLKAMITYPKLAGSIIKGLPTFIASIPSMLFYSEKSLTHRDLHFKNIMLSKRKIVLIDLQQCVYTDPLHELVTTLRYSWKKDLFASLLLNAINKRYGVRKDFTKLLRGFMVNSATHGLTGSGYSKDTVNRWIDFLDYATRITKIN